MTTASARLRRVALAAALASGTTTVIAMSHAGPVAAATLVVNSTIDKADGADGLCTLREAVTSANTDTASGGVAGECVAGSGADVINLPDGTYPLDNGGELAITTDITIDGDPDGNGTRAVIDGGAHRIFAVSVNTTTLELVDLVLQNGSTADGNGGGAIRNLFATVTLDNVDALNNSTAPTANYDVGGAIYNLGGSLTITGGTFSGNSAADDGGAIFSGGNTNASTTIVGATITSNSAERGGGVANNFGTLDIDASTLSGNDATGSGGAAFSRTGLTIIRSTLSGNTSDVGAAALLHTGPGSVTIENSTFSGNTGPANGAIYITGGSTSTMSHTTVTANDSGIDAAAGTLQVSSSIVSGNTDFDLDGAGSAYVSGGGNVVGVVDPAITAFGSDVVGADPLLGPLQDNGGPTLTHALQYGSPALDLAVDSVLGGTDQRGAGFVRRAGSFADAGAVEYQCDGAVYTAATTGQWYYATGCFTQGGAENWTITVTADIDVSKEIVLDNFAGPLTIAGSGASRTIDAGGASRILSVAAGSTVSLQQLVLTGGSAPAFPEADGGAIVNSGTLTLDRVTISDSSAAFNGGAIHNQGILTVEESTLHGNDAGFWGGALWNQSWAVVRNSTISGNSAATRGGGIYHTGTSLDVEYSTITANTVQPGLQGGGVYATSVAAPARLTASIVAGNAVDDLSSDGDDQEPDFASDGFNVIGVITGNDPVAVASDVVGVVPLLGPLQDNGGPTLTHDLLDGSPAIDLVTGTAGTDPATDQRGVARPIGDHDDAGAVESSSCPTGPWTAANAAELVEALSCFNAMPSGSHTLTLTADITKSGATAAIDNPDAELLLDGDGHTIDGAGFGSVLAVAADSTVTARDVILTGGISGLAGGGLLTLGDTTLERVTISNSSAAFGGGLQQEAGTLRILDSTISGNTSSGPMGIGEGGGIRILDGTTEIDGSTISGNDAEIAGGIRVRKIDGNPVVTITNSTISGNTDESFAGGVFNSGGDITVRFSTITDNSSVTGVDGVWNDAFGQPSAKLELRGTIIAGNDGTDLTGDAAIVSNGGNVIGSLGTGITAFGTSDTTGADPLLGPLQDNGGSTLTHLPAPTSPAVAAIATAITGDPAVDQRGVTRPQYGQLDAGSVECADLACDRDADDDGLRDDLDNCPGTANPDQTDTDTDGTGNACDPDDDGDNINDDTDNCPTTNNPDQTDTDTDGTGNACDPDDDGDNINDDLDNCPTTPNPDQTDTDDDGIGDACDPQDDRPSVPAFESVDPARYFDSRPLGETFDGQFQRGGRVTVGQRIDVPIAGRGDVPAGATAAIVNLTAVNGTGTGYATAHPCLATAPNASSVNFRAGGIEPNEIIVKLDARGHLCVDVFDAETHLLVDVVGFIRDGSPYTAVAPSRFADSRARGETFDDADVRFGPVTPGTTVRVPVAGRGSVPAGATAAAVNLTVSRGQGTGYATVHPCLDDIPNASSINYRAGENRPNEIIAKLDGSGALCISVFDATTELILDVVGYLETTPSYTPITPARFADTRPVGDTIDDVNQATGLVQPGETYRVQVAGRGVVPDDATLALANLTVVNTQGTGYATVHPCLDEVPNASSINYFAGTVRPNELVAQLDADGGICITVAEAATNLIIDIVGHDGS